MIAYITGMVLSKQERKLVLLVGGVGYLVYMPRRILDETAIDAPLSCYIHTHVREDDISLYGFLHDHELKFFELLLTVSGVGPKLALDILSAPLEQVSNAIAHKDSVFLTHIPGIGKKTAERIIVDLQGKVLAKEAGDSSEGASPYDEEMVQALISLGFTRQYVINGLKKVPQELVTEEAIIKFFLQNR